ncbi:nitrate- and nitrite sensing domain-containing protein [Streptomyces sp. NPDC014734]|uniref:sensor histidine kinase n=1 Tax=Streptomyces sp. NPDC014734 TaxID=3364886 RepID=UPI0036F5DF06
MQKKRPRSKVSEHSGSGATPPVSAGSESARRAVRVRSRLVAGVAVVGITVIAAGAPAILGASADLSESQRLVTLAELNQQAVALAHALADERDGVTALLATGRDKKSGDKKSEDKSDADARGARVDRQVDEIGDAAPAALRRDLATIPSVRRDALGGKGTALEVHQAYTEIIAKLHAVADELARKTPPRAAEATRAPLALGRATEQASSARGLLLAALSVPAQDTSPQTDPFTGLPVETQDKGDDEDDRTRDGLSAAAQQARVGELASLADFDQSASPTTRDTLASTVTGPEVTKAEKYLSTLADRPELSESDRRTSRKKVEEALSARLDRMRSVESALGTEQVAHLEELRDDDVTALELRVALLGGCLLIAVAVSTAVARTLTQPLAVLRIGAARLAAEPATAEPVRYKGRNDEFAQVVRSVNALHGRLRELLGEQHGRVEGQRAEHAELLAAREELAARRAEFQRVTTELTTQLEQLKHTVHHTFVNLSLRTLGLVERQLGVIESLEDREQDPEQLATLFKLDHMATVMRRHGENMLVLAGTEHSHSHAGPIPLVDVARAAVSEIERYERVTIQALPPHAQIAGFAADDLSHLVAELLENATSFSPPDSQVQLSGWLLESGEVMLSVQDEGIGMPAERMGELNSRLGDPALFDAVERDDRGETESGLGLHVAALLAARHGVRVQLREHTGSGVTAVVVLPKALLPKAPSAATPPAVKVAGDGPGLNLPGSVAEANSNALPARAPGHVDDALPARTPGHVDDGLPARASGHVDDGLPAVVSDQSGDALAARTPDRPGDPLIAAAERAIRASEAAAGTEAAPAPDRAAEHLATPKAADPDPVADVEPSPAAHLPAPETHAQADEAEFAFDSEFGSESDPEFGSESEFGSEFGSDSESETTMQVRLPVAPTTGDAPGVAAPGPYAIGPDRHERTADASPEQFRPAEPTPPAPEPHPAPAPEPYAEPEPHFAPAPAADTAPEPHTGPETHHTVPEPHTGSQTHTVPAPRRPEQTQPDQPLRERLTDKGLPKRTPRVVKAGTAPAAERKGGGLDKEALRRRLGGFHQGAKDGRRDVEAELAGTPETQPPTGGTAPAAPVAHTDHRAPAARTAPTDHRASAAPTDHRAPADRTNDRTDETGDTVEEARS